MSSDVNAQNVVEEALSIEDETLFLPTDTNARMYQIERSIQSFRVRLRESESDFPAPQAGRESELPPAKVDTRTRELARKIANLSEVLRRHSENVTRQESELPLAEVDTRIRELARKIANYSEVLCRYSEDVTRQESEVSKPSQKNAPSLPIPIVEIQAPRKRKEVRKEDLSKG